MQTPRYVSRFEPLLYVPAFMQKDFHYVHTGLPTKGTSTEEFTITNLEYATFLSNTTTSTQEARHKAKLNHNHLYTRGIGTKPKLNHLYTRGIGTMPKLNYLYTRGISTNLKQRKITTW